MKNECLNADEYNPYYKGYIAQTTDKNIPKGLEQNMKKVSAFFTTIPAAKYDYSYADGKWTIKDILLHLMDTERIFSYRALRIARHDTTAMSGFNQDDYVISADAKSRGMESLLTEYSAIRQSSIALFSSFDAAALIKKGVASGTVISVRAIGYILTGHENHHIKIINERYL